jgi:hypothetical protein
MATQARQSNDTHFKHGQYWQPIHLASKIIRLCSTKNQVCQPQISNLDRMHIEVNHILIQSGPKHFLILLTTHVKKLFFSALNEQNFGKIFKDLKII